MKRLNNEVKTSYYNYRVGVSTKHLGIMLLIVTFFNLFLIIPDLYHMDGSYKSIIILFLRSAFSITLMILFFNVKKVKTFSAYTKVVTFLEIMGIVLFLFVLSQYENPNLLIQTLGLMILIMVIFLVPNKQINMIIVSVLGSITFFACAYYYVNNLESSEFIAALTYIAIAIILCSQTARISENHYFKEFQAKCELERISSTDHLTKIANRHKLEEDANRWIGFCQRQNLPLSIVFIDIDDFKTINDNHGHVLGDFVLTKLTEIIISHLRSSDIIARWGGDEFVILLPSTKLNEAIAATKKIQTAISETIFTKNVLVTCCFGIVEMKDNASFEHLIQKADSLMYQAKKIKKNNINY